jgi:phospholipid/cholesterol/gamma-HCH transport system substrate-binding protein
MNTVNGLMPGNNVRFKGIDVGTVKEIELTEDGSIFVVMIIDDKMENYIQENAVASIGSDGLMGNKLVNITPQKGSASPVKQGSVIMSREPLETDEMLRTLNTTNNTIERVTRNLDEITIKLNTSKSLWNLLSDTMITRDLKNGVNDFRSAAANTASLTGNAKEIVNRFGDGGGLAGTLFTDTTLTRRLDHSLSMIQEASEKTAAMMNNLELVVNNMKAGEGTAGLLLADTTLRSTLMESATHLEEGTSRFNENMEALKSNFLFRRYFRKKEKERMQSIKAKEKQREPAINGKDDEEIISKKNQQ